jgi:AraC-like DNA-binding protein
VTTKAVDPKPIVRWTTDLLPTAERFDYFADALSSAIVPMQVECPSSDHFRSNMCALDLGAFTVVEQTGTAHASFRGPRDIARSGERSYHLVLNRRSAWTITHCGRVALQPGDAVLTDSRYPHSLELASDYDIVHLKLMPAWLERWVHDPHVLLGRVLAKDELWTRALTAHLSCLSPHTLARSPVPADVVIDQVGALLALTALEAGGAPLRRPDAVLCTRIHDCIVQRCAEPGIKASDVADSLAIPVSLLHAVLLTFQTSFEEVLLATRVRIACRMLESPLFRRVVLVDVAKRAGFANISLMRAALTRRGFGIRTIGRTRTLRRL